MADHGAAARAARLRSGAAARAARLRSGAAARAARRERWQRWFPAWAAAAAGAAISAAFLFQRALPLRAAMFALFFAAAWLSGKKVSPLATLLVSAGIVAANLLVPVGRLLAQLGPLRITEAALLDGIGKALVFEGLVCVSKASVLPGLRLPGRFGGLVAAAFLYYDSIVEYKGGLRPATLIADADRLMLFIWEGPMGDTGGGSGPAMKPGPAAALIAAVLAAYLPFVLSLPGH